MTLRENRICMFKRLKPEGISLRFLYKGMVVMAVVLSALLIFSTFHLTSTFRELSGVMDEYIDLQKAAHDLNEASDYLTEQVQRFCVTGNVEFLNAYFEEAFEKRRRDEALSVMAQHPNSKKALMHLQKSMDSSMDLMNLEYYAMKLVIEAQGITGYPDVLDEVELSEKDASLSKENKMALARSVVHGTDYYDRKDVIRKEMQKAMDELDKLAYGIREGTTSSSRTEILVARVLIIIQTAGILFLIWLTLHLGINPVLQAVDRIRTDNPIPEMGAIEFRYLAKTYNRMYEFYRQTVNNLNFRASHDELTKVYNRAGYDLLLESLDLSSTCMVIIDIDNFKDVNDTYGHDTGDRILKKTASTLLKNFRSEDYVCRIGGDEFVVFMIHAGSTLNRRLLTKKIRQINEELADTRDSLPYTSISAGAASGKGLSSAEDLYIFADKALYETKRKGRRGISFYDE